VDLKIISQNEFLKMTSGMKHYNLNLLERTSSKNTLKENLSLDSSIDPNWGSIVIFAKSKETHIFDVKRYFKKGCAETTKLYKFPQGNKITVLVGDPYLIEVTIEGIYCPKDHELKRICLKTNSGTYIFGMIVGIIGEKFISYIEIK
jgi:hypothetical protein